MVVRLVVLVCASVGYGFCYYRGVWDGDAGDETGRIRIHANSHSGENQEKRYFEQHSRMVVELRSRIDVSVVWSPLLDIVALLC